MQPMQILFIDIGLSFGGSLVVAARASRALEAMGHTCTIVTPVDPELILHHFSPTTEVIQLQKSVTYKHRLDFDAKIKSFKSNIVRTLWSRCFSVYEWVNNIGYRHNIASVIKSKNIEVIHNNNCLDSNGVASRLGIPLVWHFHGCFYDNSRMTRYSLQKCAHYIAISNFVYETVMTHGWMEKEHISTLLNPVQQTVEQYADETLDSKRAELGLQGCYVIGVFGRLINWKGQAECIDAIGIVADELPNVKLLLIGDDSEFGGYKDHLVRKVETKNLADVVHFTGYTKETDLFYQMCDLVVHSSIEPEPFGLVITEAMLNQTPIVASCHGAGPELVNDGINGLIADPLNPEDLANKILKVANSETLQKQFVDNGMELVNTLSAESYAKKLFEIYQKVNTNTQK